MAANPQTTDTHSAMTISPIYEAALNDLPMLSLDLETTGLDVARDRIVQVGGFSMRGGSRDIRPAIDRLVNPGIPVPPSATAIHGISNDDVADAQPIGAVAAELAALFEGRVVIGHHVEFDLAVLRHEAKRSGYDWIDPPSLDTAALAVALAPQLPDHGLETVARWLGVATKNRHTAVGDSWTAAQIFIQLVPLLHDRNIDSFDAALAFAATREDLIQHARFAGWYKQPVSTSKGRGPTFRHQLDRLRERKDAQVADVRARLVEGERATDIQAHISQENVDLHRGVIEICINEMAEKGEGCPPVAFDAIIIGSGGRQESLLFPDQDNGFVIADVPENKLVGVDQWFKVLATKMTDALADVGFYRCPGWIMATNPRWRKTLEGYTRQVSDWIEDASGDALHYCNIFLDFKSFYGNGNLAHALRASSAKRAQDPRFLMRLNDVNRSQTGALGWFGRIHTVADPGPNHGKIDLKSGGTLPVFTAARLLSLFHGASGGSTIGRLRELGNRGLLDRADDIEAAYEFIVRLILRQQVEDHRSRAPMGNCVSPAVLRREDRSRLVAALKLVRAFRRDVSKKISTLTTGPSQ